ATTTSSRRSAPPAPSPRDTRRRSGSNTSESRPGLPHDPEGPAQAVVAEEHAAAVPGRDGRPHTGLVRCPYGHAPGAGCGHLGAYLLGTTSRPVERDHDGLAVKGGPERA